MVSKSLVKAMRMTMDAQLENERKLLETQIDQAILKTASGSVNWSCEVSVVTISDRVVLHTIEEYRKEGWKIDTRWNDGRIVSILVEEP